MPHLLVLLLLFLPSIAWAQSSAIISNKDRHHPVYAANGVVASQEARATNVGVNILAHGGNAIDAATGNLENRESIDHDRP